jgi:hypothetical protein
MKGWKPLGSVDAHHLVNARLQLHWAAQVAAAVGKQLLPSQPDFGQQSFAWLEEAGALAQGIVLEGTPPFRSTLRLADLTLGLLDAGQTPLAELTLSGHTLDEAYAWLTAEVEARLGRPLEQPLERPGPPPAMPGHPVGTGRRFTLADPAPFVEVARWFTDADLLLREIAEREPGASPVRCWPHHFDLATLIPLEASEPAETGRSIGVGLSPGDTGRGTPYFYVTPWPAPLSPELPALAGGGTWNTEGWQGAVLEAGALLVGTSGSDPEGQARQFLESAIDACRELLAKA